MTIKSTAPNSRACKVSSITRNGPADKQFIKLAAGNFDVAVVPDRSPVLALVAWLAGIMAAKKTWGLIPLCHPLMLTGIDVSFSSKPETGEIAIEARVKTVGKTGVEMEALAAVSVALLTVYDMCKAVDKTMEIGSIRLIEKTKTDMKV